MPRATVKLSANLWDSPAKKRRRRAVEGYKKAMNEEKNGERRNRRNK